VSAPSGLDRVRARIAAACARSGRDPADVTLVAVTKGQSVETIARLVAAGQRVLGENRLQEWRDKHAALGGDVEWHLVGHLQRNKVRTCTPFALIHSLDSLRLAEALEEEGARTGHVFPVLIQVNVSGEATKHGVAPADTVTLLEATHALPHVRVEGLMTMAPYHEDPERARGVFRALRDLRARLGLRVLSMGMSGDLDVAIEEGATHVRVGTALFAPAGGTRSGSDVTPP
jgi:PLP dependent protein